MTPERWEDLRIAALQRGLLTQAEALELLLALLEARPELSKEYKVVRSGG